MAAPNLESLIQAATNPLNRDDDPNAIQAVWHTVSAEAGNVQTAVRLLAHKIQSPQEREAVQALAVLEACVNNCGTSFHAEIGKFRFLNEMIKLVSPKYLGNHTAASVKRRVIELVFTWTIDLSYEAKILEAYNMLKKQGVVKEDPAYLGVPTAPEPRSRDKNAVFEDEEKAKLLQKLLQSKNPEDLHKANALIKSMVKEDERKMERCSRRIVEVETAQNNCGVLDEMLSRQQENSGEVSQADLDLMAELHTSCTNLRANIYRLVSEMDEKEEGIGDLLKANDELSRVMGRYRLVIDGNKEVAASSGTGSSNTNDREADGKEVLLDLSTPEDNPTNTSAVTSIINQDLQDLGLGGLSLGENSFAVSSAPLSATPITPVSLLGGTETIKIMPPTTEGASLMDDLGSVFSTPTGGATNSSILASPLLPQSSTAVVNIPVLGSESVSDARSNPLDELDILASASTSSLGLQNLNLANIDQKSHFKTQEKLSMNQLKQQKLSTTLNTHQPSVPVAATLSSSPLLPLSSRDPCVTSEVVTASSVMNIDLLDALGSDSSTSTIVNANTSVTTSASPATISLLDDFSSDITDLSCNNTSTTDVNLIDNNLSNTTTNNTTDTNDKDEEVLDATGTESSSNNVTITTSKAVKVPPKSGSSNAQLMDVKPMTDIKVDLQSIKSGKQTSLELIESNEITVSLHFTDNQPREDVSVAVLSTMSRNTSSLSNYVLQAVVPKGCKVRLQAPSSTEFSGYSPFLPPPTVTQIMLIANPNKLNVSLKVMLSYTQDDDPMTEMGEVDTLPL